MDKRGMGTEPLAGSVRKAQAAMQELRMALHYLHCIICTVTGSESGPIRRSERRASCARTHSSKLTARAIWQRPNQPKAGRAPPLLTRLPTHPAANGHCPQAESTEAEQDDG